MQVQCGCGGPAREHAAPTGATARLFVAFRCFMGPARQCTPASALSDAQVQGPGGTTEEQGDMEDNDERDRRG